MKKFIRDCDIVAEIMEEDVEKVPEKVNNKGRDAAYRRHQNYVKARHKREIAEEVFGSKQWSDEKSNGAFSKHSFSCDCVMCTENKRLK
jgi:hypothetical protein